ncbi:hypothetical protein PLESTB_001351900 [Pleodorina starrii]|uniref:Uncharacterized protein n=1 Tax=Pleodorina starrii TaxID=330485 RepID=A0A9W6BUE8_9CHLO|nr:hypothetical protein PLESTB_001351900 [Pleodorina starrii]
MSIPVLLAPFGFRWILTPIENGVPAAVAVFTDDGQPGREMSDQVLCAIRDTGKRHECEDATEDAAAGACSALSGPWGRGGELGGSWGRLLLGPALRKARADMKARASEGARPNFKKHTIASKGRARTEKPTRPAAPRGMRH